MHPMFACDYYTPTTTTTNKRFVVNDHTVVFRQICNDPDEILCKSVVESMYTVRPIVKRNAPFLPPSTPLHFWYTKDASHEA